MSNPTLPPYLGTWDELVQALLHNPFLGSGSGIHHKLFEESRGSNQPASTAHSPAVSLLMAGIGAKQVASRLKDSNLRSEMVAAAEQSIADWEDEFCGTPPRPHPWVFLTAVELAAFANTLPQGALQGEVLRVAGQLIQKSFGAGAPRQSAATAGR